MRQGVRIPDRSEITADLPLSLDVAAHRLPRRRDGASSIAGNVPGSGRRNSDMSWNGKPASPADIVR